MRSWSFLLTLFLTLTSAIAGGILDKYPILTIPKNSNSEALLGHNLTPDERTLFKEIDARTAKLPRDADLAAYHKVAIEIGSRNGLSPRQSIAFFTRTTFSEFEP